MTVQHAHMQANRTAAKQGMSRSASAYKEPTQGMYGLEATHPQYPQAVLMPGKVAVKSLGQDGQA